MKNILDPLVKNRELLKAIENGSGVGFVDPTTPLALVIESMATTAANNLVETNRLITGTYPTLADSKQEIMRHVSDEDIIGVMATPANGEFIIYVNVVDVLGSTRKLLKDQTYKSVTIYAGTTITVDSKTFTIEYDVNIHYDGNVSLVEMIHNDVVSDGTVGSLGNIRSVITDIGEEKWIRFNIPAVQYSKVTTRLDMIEKMKHTVPVTPGSTIYKIEASGEYDSGLRKLGVTMSDIVYNTAMPTIKVSTIDDGETTNVDISLPEIYAYNGTKPSAIYLDIYETVGDLKINLNEFEYDDFVIGTPGNGQSEYKGFTLRVLSNNIVDGGSNPKTLEQLRESVIRNTIGANNNPVTIDQLDENASRHNYDISLYQDTVTMRKFIISKDISYELFDQLSSVPDIYLSKTRLVPGVDGLKTVRSGSLNAIIIDAGTTFINTGGTCVPSTNVGVNSNTLSRLDAITECGQNDYFRTLYTNIVYPDKYETRVFDLNTPSCNTLNIVNKNSNTEFNTDIDDISIQKVDGGYWIDVELSALTALTTSGMGDIHAQLIIKSELEKHVLYINSITLEPGKLRFILDSDNMVTLDDEIIINLTDTDAFKLGLETSATILLYKLNTVANQDTYGDQALLNKDVIPNISNTTPLVVLTHQTVNVVFGHRLNDLFTNTIVSYTDRKYKHYSLDIPAYYKEDVWDFNDDCDSLDVPKHSAGDPMLDADNNVIYAHRKGDVIMSAGEPVIDVDNALMIVTDMLMVEYEYTYTTTPRFVKTIDMLRENIMTHLRFVDDIGKNRLELTEFNYRPTKNSSGLVVISNDVTHYVSPIVSPVITLYVDKYVTFNYDKKQIGSTLQTMLNNSTVSVKDIRNKLTEQLAIKAVGISNIFDGISGEVFKVSGGTPIVKKSLMLEDDVEYDITVIVEAI